MGKKRAAKDRAYLTASEWREEHGGCVLPLPLLLPAALPTCALHNQRQCCANMAAWLVHASPDCWRRRLWLAAKLPAAEARAAAVALPWLPRVPSLPLPLVDAQRPPSPPHASPFCAPRSYKGDRRGPSFKRLPFTHCAISFQPFEDPVGAGFHVCV